jgi:hypothetical protein
MSQYHIAGNGDLERVLNDAFILQKSKDFLTGTEAI